MTRLEKTIGLFYNLMFHSYTACFPFDHNSGYIQFVNASPHFSTKFDYAKFVRFKTAFHTVAMCLTENG